MKNDKNSEYEIKLHESDTIQTIIFYKTNQVNYFLTGGWDGIFRIFEFSTNENTKQEISQIHSIPFNFPIISLFRKKNTPIIFIGNILGEVFSYDISTNEIMHLLDLDSSIIEIFEFSYFTSDSNGNSIENTRLITAEYEGKIQIFEYTTENENCKLEFSHQSEIGLFSVSLNYPILSAGLSNGNIIYFDLRKCYDNNKSILEPEEIILSELEGIMHLTCALNNKRGIVSCNLESKVFVCPIEINEREPKEINETDCFTFSVHREIKENPVNNNSLILHQVNCLKNFEIFDCFATCGSEGNLSIWNDKIKERTFTYNNKYKLPITAFNFSDDGEYCVMSLGNDYKNGCHFSNRNSTILILKVFTEEEKNQIKNFNK